MIFTDRTIIVQKGISSINDTIILYRGDKGVEIRFTLNEGSPFRFGSGASPNIIEKTEAAYGQLVIKTPNDLPAIFSEVAPTNNGKIVFTITAEMIDEITEVGNYTFQIRLLDESRNSRATIPEVVNGIEIREPIATEDISTTNEVDVAAVGYALTTAGTQEDTFDTEGNYNKTTWGTGDRITAAKLNKIEAGIDGVNKKVASGGTVSDDDLALSLQDLGYNGSICFIGDSITNGHAVEYSEQYIPKVLKKINEITGNTDEYEINFNLHDDGSRAIHGAWDRLYNGPNGTSILLKQDSKIEFTSNNAMYVDVLVNQNNSTGKLRFETNRTAYKTIDVSNGTNDYYSTYPSTPSPSGGTQSIWAEGGDVEVIGLIRKSVRGKKSGVTVMRCGNSGKGTWHFIDDAQLNYLKKIYGWSGDSKDIVLYIIFLGTNDIYNYQQKATVEEYTNNMEKLITTLYSENTNTAKFALVVPPIPDEVTWGTGTELFEKYKRVIYHLADKYDCTTIDLSKIDFLGNGYYQDDNIHPNALGSTAIANEIIKALSYGIKNNIFGTSLASQNITLGMDNGLLYVYVNGVKQGTGINISGASTNIPCTNITLNAETLSFTDSSAQTLTATLTPTDTTDSVIWSVSPTGIVAVENGTVTPVTNGTATITATCGSATATCSVTVNIASSGEEGSTSYLVNLDSSTLTSSSSTWESDNGAATFNITEGNPDVNDAGVLMSSVKLFSGSTINIVGGYTVEVTMTAYSESIEMAAIYSLEQNSTTKHGEFIRAAMICPNYGNSFSNATFTSGTEATFKIEYTTDGIKLYKDGTFLETINIKDGDSLPNGDYTLTLGIAPWDGYNNATSNFRIKSFKLWI